MKDIEKAYDKGVEDGRKQMLDELMDAFYNKLADDTRKQVRNYVERQRFASGCGCGCGCDYEMPVYFVPK